MSRAENASDHGKVTMVRESCIEKDASYGTLCSEIAKDTNVSAVTIHTVGNHSERGSKRQKRSMFGWNDARKLVFGVCDPRHLKIALSYSGIRVPILFQPTILEP